MNYNIILPQSLMVTSGLLTAFINMQIYSNDKPNIKSIIVSQLILTIIVTRFIITFVLKDINDKIAFTIAGILLSNYIVWSNYNKWKKNKNL